MTSAIESYVDRADLLRDELWDAKREVASQRKEIERLKDINRQLERVLDIRERALRELGDGM
jgi:phage shock protein A